MSRKSVVKKSLGLILTVLCFIALLAGCSDKEVKAIKESTEKTTQSQIGIQDQTTIQSQTAASETSSQKASPESQVNRYDEIIDRSKDSGKLSIYFLKLSVSKEAKDKSGDCTVLISPEGKVMMIDTGHPESASQVVQFLKDLGIKKIDELVISHPHIDHIGGVSEVLKNFQVDQLYRTALEYPTQTYKTYVEGVKQANIPVTYLKEGDTFTFGSKINIEVFNPEEKVVYPQGYPDNSTAFVNNNSMAIKLSYGQSSAFFGGDLYLSQEGDLVEKYGQKLQADILKGDHHGENTSNSKRWIKTISPKIMVAMHDKVGSMDVYNNYVKAGAQCYYTALNGIVKVTADDQKNYKVIKQFDSWMNE